MYHYPIPFIIVTRAEHIRKTGLNTKIHCIVKPTPLYIICGNGVLHVQLIYWILARNERLLKKGKCLQYKKNGRSDLVRGSVGERASAAF